MAEERKGMSAGVIAAIAAAVVAAGGGGIAVMTMNPAAQAPSPTVLTEATDPTAGVQSAPTADPAAPASPLVPLQPGVATLSPDGSISFIDDSLTFSAILPKGADTDPIIKRLRAETQAHLDKRKAEARADFEDRKKQGAIEMSWEVQVAWKYTAQAGGIASLAGTAYEFTGGAHGMTYTDTLIAKADTGEALTLPQMLLPDRVPSPAITIAICEALKTAKLKAINAATIMDEPIVCAGPAANVKIDEAHVALAPSTEADKFGGLFVYYDAYAVGSYAEGPYSLVVPQAVFREDIRPQYKNLFGGEIPQGSKP
jgi:Deacetylase PdaC